MVHVRLNFRANKMIERELVLRDWAEVLRNYSVPASLRDHQIDAMSLLKQGKHVFLGKMRSRVLN